MSYSWQHQLVSRIFRNGDLGSVINWGITLEDFTAAEARAMFNNIIAYHTSPETMGSVWGPQALHQKFPNFPLCDDASMTTDALCREVRLDRIRAEAKYIVQKAQDIIDGDPIQAVGMLQEHATRLRNDCTPKKVDVHIGDALPAIYNKYCAAERGELVSVAPWPWEPLQSKTLGIRDTDFIIFYGRPKSMKSWIICYLIGFLVNRSDTYRILIYSKEMAADEMFERIGCVLAGIDYEHFTGGKLTPEEKYNFYVVAEFLRVRREQMTVVCLSAQDVGQGQDTVTWLESKIKRFQPHIVFVDGMYLMSDGLGTKKLYERITNVSRAMRQLILHSHVPVIASVQANRQAAQNEDANTEEVAFSDSLGQDATMLIRVVNEWRKGANTLALVMGGATRRYKLPGFRVYGMPALNFGYFGELSEKEALNAVKTDAAAKEAKAVKPTAGERKKNEAQQAAQAASEMSSLVAP